MPFRFFKTNQIARCKHLNVGLYTALACLLGFIILIVVALMPVKKPAD